MDEEVFPPLSRADVLACQFSSWYPSFAPHSIKSTVVRPLPRAFADYLAADGVFLPAGAEDSVAREDDDTDSDGDEDEESEAREEFAFPEIDARIRAAVQEYGAVFPKLNFSSPKDAAWLLPPSSPLRCATPADVYMLLKSSDFTTHDLDAHAVFAGCVDSGDADGDYELELVLRKWHPVERARELRLFVRDGALLGMSQRDDNAYDWLNDPATQSQIARAVSAHWAAHIAPRWRGPRSYVLDVLLTRDLARFHILDFAPYAPRTDALLFTYADLHALHLRRSDGDAPEFRVVRMDAPRPAAPANAHNMVPLEALSLSAGRGVAEFQRVWAEEVQRGMQDSDSDEEGEDEGAEK